MNVNKNIYIRIPIYTLPLNPLNYQGLTLFKKRGKRRGKKTLKTLRPGSRPDLIPWMDEGGLEIQMVGQLASLNQLMPGLMSQTLLGKVMSTTRLLPEAGTHPVLTKICLAGSFLSLPMQKCKTFPLPSLHTLTPFFHYSHAMCFNLIEKIFSWHLMLLFYHNYFLTCWNVRPFFIYDCSASQQSIF